VRRLLRRLSLAARNLPIHRWFAVLLLAGLALPDGSVTVALGHIWPAGPMPFYVLLASSEILLLWWIGRRPVLGLAAISGVFLLVQAFAWPATTADLSIVVALAVVGARTPTRTALVSAAAVTTALAVFMVVAQAPGHPEAMGYAILASVWIVVIPLAIGMGYRRTLSRAARGTGAPGAEPVAHGAEAAVIDRPPLPDSMRLTARELGILNLVAQGLTNTEIAAELTIGRETVKTHIGNILAKLGARDRTHAVTVAYRNRLIDDR
jgi:DNA-binding CsgD family transcriptional regulator